MNEKPKTEQTLKKMPELLAPAGDFQAFLGAINAGADAVYLAGNMFGARAYAKNFSEEEILEALTYAHINHKKIYLTVNTLTKEDELSRLYGFLKPFYLAGLDGVIVQDFGVFSYIRNVFPELPIHVSTQMSITSYLGAKYMQSLGATRIVPARELSLAEIKEINALGVETECFIHGSMCYCYSGQCLFSSFLGNRSGNRGRCAGPCRQPYSLEGNKKEEYLLSLKDLCTLEILPKLIDAGISSFKIEGRMKSAAYAAGVSEIYRKYIDLYCKTGNINAYKADPKDLEKLKYLYLRTDLQDGYYEKSKSISMVSIKSPSYNKTDDALCAVLNDKYCRNKVPVSVPVTASFVTGKEAELRIDTFNGSSLIINGDTVQKAQKAPLSEEDLVKRLKKSSNGYFSFDVTEMNLSDDAFLPVGAINALRRNAEEQLTSLYQKEFVMGSGTITNAVMGSGTLSTACNGFRLFVTNLQQFETLADIVRGDDEICIPISFFSDSNLKNTENILKNHPDIRFFAVLPSVIRSANLVKHQNEISRILQFENVKGFYVSQPDSLALIKEMTEKSGKTFEIRGDMAFYIANRNSLTLFSNELNSFTVSPELSRAEIPDLAGDNAELMIYGRIPLMQTANCVLNTTGNCRKEEGFTFISDRMKARFPIYTHCSEKICYNTIYNSVPLSLHKHMPEILKYKCGGLQIRFTNESPKELQDVYHIFDEGRSGILPGNVPYDFTNGHYLKGVL